MDTFGYPDFKAVIPMFTRSLVIKRVKKNLKINCSKNSSKNENAKSLTCTSCDERGVSLESASRMSAASKLGHFNREEYIVLDDKMTLLNCVKAK